MEETPHITTRMLGSIGWISLNRPDQANAYTQPMLEVIRTSVDSMSADTAIRAIVFESRVEGIFCGGADLEELGTRSASDALKLESMKVFDAIANCPKPTMAAIDGPAVAGGLELALACDLRVATDRAWFALPETSLGLIPAAGATFRLPRIAGEAVARRMMLFGERLDAEGALGCGLIDHMTTPDRLTGEVHRRAEEAARLDPLAVQLAKTALDHWADAARCRTTTLEAQAVLYERRHGSPKGSSHDD